MEAVTRDDYATVARRAQALYQQGCSAPEVLRECYGINFPGEIFLIAGSDLRARGPAIRFPLQPWRLIPPTGSDDVPLTPPGSDAVERELFQRDSDLFPLAFLIRREPRHGNMLACYRLSDLAVGRSTVYGVFGVTLRFPDSLDVASAVTRLGDSLLTVLREYFVDFYERLKVEADKESAWGTDAIDDETLERAEGFVDLAEELFGRSAAGQDGLGEATSGAGSARGAASNAEEGGGPSEVVRTAARPAVANGEVLQGEDIATTDELAAADGSGTPNDEQQSPPLTITNRGELASGAEPAPDDAVPPSGLVNTAEETTGAGQIDPKPRAL